MYGRNRVPEPAARMTAFMFARLTIIAFHNALHNVITSGNRWPQALARITVVGSGYAGLGTAIAFARKGNTVTCVDSNPSKVETLSRGRSPIFEKGLDRETGAAASAPTDVGDCVRGSGVGHRVPLRRRRSSPPRSLAAPSGGNPSRSRSAHPLDISMATTVIEALPYSSSCRSYLGLAGFETVMLLARILSGMDSHRSDEKDHDRR